jgi:hypothetical protein
MVMNDKTVHEKAILYDVVLRKILDDHAPVMQKEIKVKMRCSWYNQDLRNLKKEKRKVEQTWLKSKTDEDQTSFKKVRSEYILKCNQAKTDYYSNEVQKCGGDQKKLYNLVTKLTKGEQVTPYPDAESEEQLCKMFGDFFIQRLTRS